MLLFSIKMAWHSVWLSVGVIMPIEQVVKRFIVNLPQLFIREDQRQQVNATWDTEYKEKGKADCGGGALHRPQDSNAHQLEKGK